jgi:exonuclease III
MIINRFRAALNPALTRLNFRNINVNVRKVLCSVGRIEEVGGEHINDIDINPCKVSSDNKSDSDQISSSVPSLNRQNQNTNGENQCSFNPFVKEIVIISAAMMLNLVIYLTLLKQNVERNPGPKEELKIITYNCNGLGNKEKLRRLLNKAKPLVDGGAIILLQETHIVDISYVKLIWKHGCESNCVRTNASGTMILYNNSLKIITKSTDNEGRRLNIVLQEEDDESGFILSNVYFPNDHKAAIEFSEQTYMDILKLQSDYPNFLTVCAGDFNTCLTEKDRMNRGTSTTEQQLAFTISENNKVTKLADGYRHLQPEQGYTWKRGNQYSRLDHIFVSRELLPLISSALTDWSFDTSDHAAVILTIDKKEEVRKGPGIVKVNVKILEDPKVTNEVGIEILRMMNQAEAHWDPHTKLEFLKVAIRTSIAERVTEIRRGIKEEVKETEDELNSMEVIKIERLIKHPDQQTDTINSAINTLKSKLAEDRKNLSKTMSFVSKAKWFEFGEKPNKFFLNLNKCRQRQKLISEIKNGEKKAKGQEKVSKLIADFYRDLYSKKERPDQFKEDYYQHCPKLNEDQKQFMDNNLTLKELKEALFTCQESAPGPDGITYGIYKKYWGIVGQVLLDSCNYSLSSGKMPRSHLESIITLLPKDGKDRLDIKNWRPITLTNCDAKIITKALSIKMAKVLDSIIDPSQTAYVKGRAVADNLRTNFFLKKYCQEKDVNSVLISLDAKKAFDSVDHQYIEETLEKYGFGTGFIKTFRILYSDLTARVMVNGFLSEAISIGRGVKQGDALSCAIFIICIDPLLRNLNHNQSIKGVKINRTNEIKFKAAAYADDVSVVCGSDLNSIQGVFSEYEEMTRRSGLELNADKTEILILNNKEHKQLIIKYNGGTFNIFTVNSIKICGLWFAREKEEEHMLNIQNKIGKLESKIKGWTHRGLTMEGKILIVKTFGLSQLIYNMQCVKFKKKDLKIVESIIFKFLWSTNTNQNGIDRIRRAVMKNDYDHGGMKVTDPESLDRSLKLRQFIRASKSNHEIAKIQAMLSKCNGSNNQVRQEYYPVTEEEDICQSAQESLNMITDNNRKEYCTLEPEEYENNKILIDEVSSINIESYLNRKGRPLQLCIAKKVLIDGHTSLGGILQAMEYETNEQKIISIKMILSEFPNKLKEIATCVQSEVDNVEDSIRYLNMQKGKVMDIEMITTKEFQTTFKQILNKTETFDYNHKLGIDYDKENIMRFRNNCKNPKLRNIYFRLTHNDFYTKEKMKRFKMTNSDECSRCGNKENLEHLIWECFQAQGIWSLYNELMTKIGKMTEKITYYKDVFSTPQDATTTLIKIRIIQELIQIERPSNWNKVIFNDKIKEIVRLEKYSYSARKEDSKFAILWGIIEGTNI